MAVKTMIIEYDDAVGDMIGGFPLRAPAVEVVRCRDCAHATDLRDGTLDCHGPLAAPWDYYADQPQVNVVEPGGFCAWGERRDARS